MLLIIATWVVSAFVLWNWGLLLEKVFGFSIGNRAYVFILGAIAQMMVLGLVAFFYPIDGWVFAFTMLISIGVFVRYYRNTLADMAGMLPVSGFYKRVFVLLLLVLAWFSAVPPFMIDNESYYIQTIKWLTTYGWVKGLGNLHLFLGQGSAWHVVQAGHNFSFLGQFLNNLNGLLVGIVFLYIFKEMERQNRVLGVTYLLAFLAVFVLFVTAPSPDLPLLLLLPLGLYQLMAKAEGNDTPKIVFLLFCFLTAIKLTTAPMLMIGIYMFYKTRQNGWFYIGTGLGFGGWIVAKNIILTGYPLYPLSVIATDVDWQVPAEIMQTFSPFVPQTSIIKQLYSVLKNFWFINGLDGILGKLMILVFILMPLTKWFKNEMHRVIYGLFLIHFLVIVIFSAQYRFYLPELIFFSSLLLYFFFEKQRVTPQNFKKLIVLMVLSPLLWLMQPDLLAVFDNKYHNPESLSQKSVWVIPYPDTKYPNIHFEKITAENLSFYSPTDADNFFFYGTGNAPLPALNKQQFEYIKNSLQYIPQLRNKDLENGFYSKKIDEK